MLPVNQVKYLHQLNAEAFSPGLPSCGRLPKGHRASDGVAVGTGLLTVNIGGRTGSKGCLPARKKPPMSPGREPMGDSRVPRLLWAEVSLQTETFLAPRKNHTPTVHPATPLSFPFAPSLLILIPKRVNPEREWRRWASCRRLVGVCSKAAGLVRREEGRRTGRVSGGWG